jgi:TPR repeat protein
MSAVSQSPDQQSEAGRKLLADVRANAEKGDAVVQFNLGCCYYYGKGVAKDHAEAVKWFRKAAEQNHAQAQYNMGVCHATGQGLAKDMVEAAKWYGKAAEQNHAEAQYWLGVCYANGQGVPKNEAEAIKWYRKAAEQNHATAQNALKAYSVNGQGVVKDEVEAVNWHRKAAERGNSDAQCNLGFCYDTGRGVAVDEVEAVKWYRKAAEQGNAVAQGNLGICYEHGNGVRKDKAEAAKWYRKAAQQGYAPAQYSLGTYYSNGQPVPKYPDPVESVVTWGLSALSLASGEGAAKGNAEAVMWFRKAAEQGHALAQNKLGCCYEEGYGVAKDLGEAVKWYRKAAEQGNGFGQYNLGGSYSTGTGVIKDLVQAHKWYNLASAQGLGLAGIKARLFVIERMMTREQIAEAQRRASEFKPRKAPEAGASVSGKDVVDSNPAASGTGFFITEDGFLVTNEHVVHEATQICVLSSAGSTRARVVKVDRASDLALLKADGWFTPLPVVASRTIRLGNTVATVGFPNIGLQGFAPKLAKGEIAALTGIMDDSRHFQISVPVQPGNSGGALVDERGNVVGVVAAKLNVAAAVATSGALPENVNYAVKSSFLLSFLESVPQVSAELRDANTNERKFEDVVKSAEQAAVLVLVY